MKHLVILFFLILISAVSFAQTDEIKVSIRDIKSKGVDSMLLLDNGEEIVTIPVDSFASQADISANSSSDRAFAVANDAGITSLWNSQIAGYYLRAGGASSLETGAFGPVLRPSATGAPASGPFSREYVIQNTGDASKAVFGVLGNAGAANSYAYFGSTTAASGNLESNIYRAYPTYPAWGTQRIYHQGFKPTLNEITSVAGANTSVANVLFGGPATSSIGVEIGVFSGIPAGRVMSGIGTANASFSGEVNGNLVLFPRSSLSSTSTSIYTGQNGLAFRVQGDRKIKIPILEGTGTRMVVATPLGVLEGQVIPSDASTWSTFSATQNIQLGSNRINFDGDANEGLSFIAAGDFKQQGGGTFEMPDFRSVKSTVKFSSQDRTIYELYAGDGDNLTGAQMPHERYYVPAAQYSTRNVAGSVVATQVGWDRIDLARGAPSQSQDEAHVSFNVPAGEFIAIEISGYYIDAAGVPNFFKVGAAATEGNTTATGSSEEVSIGMVTADWYTSAAGNPAFKVITPTGANWSEGVIEIKKVYASALVSLATTIEFRTTDL